MDKISDSKKASSSEKGRMPMVTTGDTCGLQSERVGYGGESPTEATKIFLVKVERFKEELYKNQKTQRKVSIHYHGTKAKPIQHRVVSLQPKGEWYITNIIKSLENSSVKLSAEMEEKIAWKICKTSLETKFYGFYNVNELVREVFKELRKLI